jgi:hypothetical protein
MKQPLTDEERKAWARLRKKYPLPTEEELEARARFRRRHLQRKAVSKAYHGDPSDLCKLLREDGWDHVADLIQRATFPRWVRAAEPLLGSFDAVVQEVYGIMRFNVWLLKRQGKKFGPGERRQFLNDVLTEMADGAELDGLSDAERERLPRTVIDLLDKGRPPARRARQARPTPEN